MCGLAGFLEPDADRPQAELCSMAARMAEAIAHRGPDDSGVWVDAQAGFGLGFRRLSIIDLSAAGHQPMESPSGRFVIAFNGEVYNAGELRPVLEADYGCRFRGRSDTEVLLAAFEAWGIQDSLRRFIGMFAIALWDRRERALTLIRDRMGLKPLYYGWQGSSFLFGSQLKALRAHPGFRAEVNREALALLLRYGYIPGPHTIYRGIRKLPPGSLLRLANFAGEDSPGAYWSITGAAMSGQDSACAGILRPEEAEEELDALLGDSVRLRMIADVPLGLFLSGGVDSSIVAAYMQARSSRPIKTFTIGFEESEHDEGPDASRVAAHLGTDHTELRVTPVQALAVIPDLPQVFDEPFADASQIPTLLVSRLARESVTVALSGDGGDELFCGYTRYLWGPRIWSSVRHLPSPLRRAVAAALDEATAHSLTVGLVGSRLDQRNPAEKLARVAGALSARGERELYRAIVSHWRNPEQAALDAREPDFVPAPPGLSLLQQLIYHDETLYLPDDILVKVDRASMSVGLEAREPLLDHRLVELSWRIAPGLKIRGGESKWILRRLLYRRVPRALIDRPKAGFSLPIETWLGGPLREWAEALLDESRLRREGFLNPQVVRRAWREHISGRRRRHRELWDVLMFQAWLDHWGRA